MQAISSYCIDTSALIDLSYLYSPDVFPRLWSNLEALINEGKVISPKEVFKELERKDDELLKWAKGFKKMFINLDPEQINKVKEIQAKFPNFVDVNKTTPEADPFLISLAINKGSTVISMEKPVNLKVNPKARPRVPDVCIDYNVKCVFLIDFFREQKWSF